MYLKIIFTCLLFSYGYTTAAAATAPKTSYLRQFMGCGLTKDVSCFLDVAEELVEEKRTEILAEADQEVIRVTGRADQENSPSHLTKVINKIIEELTDMFKDGVSGLFKSAREGEDEEDSKEDLVEESRGKKKKKKLKGLIKLLIIGAVLKAKISLLLKAFSTALQVKFFFVAVAALILNIARFYLDLKKGHQPQKVIYYEHAQHQHHYEGDDELSSGPGGSYWGRSYDLEEQNKNNNGGQDLAYAKQKPTKTEENSYSWLG